MQTDGSFFPELVILVKRNAALSDVQHFYIYAYIFLLMPFSVLALLSPALSEVVTQIRGHIAGSSPLIGARIEEILMFVVKEGLRLCNRN